MKYYFAYGSNMNQLQMRERCPDSRLLGRAVLSNHKIDFTIYSPKRQCGCADIVPVPKQEVWGLLYEVTEADAESLDLFEGHPTFYRRCEREVVDDRGVKHTVFSYEVVEKQTTLKTSKHYLGLIQKAAEEFAFPEVYRKNLSSFPTLD